MRSLIVLLFVCFSFHYSTFASRVALLVAGEPSHAPGEHEFIDNVELLSQTINAAEIGIRAYPVEGFPSDEKLASAHTVFIFSDGLANHVARGHLSALESHVAKGRGLGVIHFALEPPNEAMATFFDDVLGGYFVVDHSVNPIWTLEEPILSDHPINRGVELGAVEDEWYYHIRFVKDIEPVLQGHPPASSLGADGPRSGNPSVRAALEAGDPQTLAWVRTSESGARAFGFTGGHWHFNFGDENYRRLLINAIAWTAEIEVPVDGIQFEAVPVPRHDSIDLAIARGDLADVERHIGANPESLNEARNPSLPPLHQSILRQQFEITRHLIEAGADLNLLDGSGRSAVHLAVDRNQPELIELLLERDADPNVLCRTGWAPLHHAAAQDRTEVVAALLKGGADPMRLSERGGTPLHEGAASGGLAIAKMLIEAGTDPSVVSKTDVTALDLAIEFENKEVLPLLRRLAGESD